ncbi:MAG: type II toxin-antitoxin system RelE/ParE family toxin [Flavobacterium sp.]|nr:type II toxin-antitoxin system RelE/ParE family toxin [Flavobacterium sp.]
MHNLVFSKEALLDIEQITIWYEEQREGLSYDFELCLEDSMSQIFRNPELFQVRYKNVKVRFIKRFPYGIHYLINLDKIIVIGVFHTSRSPIDWSKKLQ